MGNNIQWLYDNLSEQGVDLGTIEQFQQAMTDKESQEWVYKIAKSKGLDLGTPDQFASAMVIQPADLSGNSAVVAEQPLNPSVKEYPAPNTEEEYQQSREIQDEASGATNNPNRPFATPLTDKDRDAMLRRKAEQMRRNAEQMSQRAGQMTLPEPSLSLEQKDGSIAAASKRVQADMHREIRKQTIAKNMLDETYSERNAVLDEMFPKEEYEKKGAQRAEYGVLAQNDPYLKAADNILMGAQIRMSDAKRQNGVSWSNVGNGLISFAKDATRHLLGDMEGILSFGTSDLRDAMIQRQVLKKIADAEAYDNPEQVLTPQEKVLYDAITTNIAVEIARQNDTSRWSKAGKITADMIPFVVDIMAGNALFKGMGNAARKAITQTVEKTVKNKLAKWLLTNVGDVAISAGESAATAAILPHTYAEMYKNTTQADMDNIGMDGDFRMKLGSIKEQDFGKSWAQAYGNEVKELFTETGGNFRLIGRALIDNPIGKKILKTPFGMVLKRFEGAQGGAGSRFASMTMYHGVLGEWLEELEGAIYDGSLKDFFTADTQLPMLLSFSVPAAFTGGLNATQHAFYQAKYDQAGKRIDQLIDASSYVGPDKNTIKGQILSTLYQTPTENIPQAIGICVEQVYPEEYRALMEGAPEKGNKAAELSYALKEYLTSGTVLTIFDPDMIGGQIADVQEHRQQLRRNAEQAAQQEIQSIAHQDGNVYRVGIQGKNDVDGYAVSGALNIDAKEDGTLSTRGRDLITIKMLDGTVEQVPADEVTLLDAPASAADRVQAVADHLFAQYANNDMFQIGDKVHIMQDGQPSEDSSTIVNITDDGVEVEIVEPDGQPNTTIIPHEQAAEMLSKDETGTEDGIVTFNTPDGELRLRQTADGVYETIAPPYAVFEESDLANMGAVRAEEAPIGESNQNRQGLDTQTPMGNGNETQGVAPAYPTDEEGNPAWGQIEVPQAAQILYDTFKHNNTSAISYADDQLKEAEKVQRQAAKQKSHSLNIAQRIAEDEQNAAFKAAADAAVKYWNDVKLAIGQIKTADEQAAKEAQQLAMQQAREQRSKTEEGTVTAPTMAERYAAADKIEGNIGTMTLPDGRELSGRYMLIAPQGVTPSHDVTKNFQRSEGYPVTSNGQSINDRDYTSDKEEQQKVVSIAQNFNGNAIKNMPVISDEGLVYNGNGRMMAGQLAALNGTDAAYMQSLMNNAAQYGFTPEQVASIPNARVVFQLDERLPYSTQSLAIFNEQETQTQNNTGKAAGYARKLTPQAVSEVLAAVDGFNTIDAFFSDKKAPFNLINSLINAGIIAQREKAEMVDGDKLSATGRERLSNILFGTVFDNETIRLMGDDAALKNSIMRALPQILDNKSLGEFSLESDINDAIRLLYEVRRAGVPFQSFVRQTVMSEDGEVHTAAENYSPFQLLLAEEMTDGGVDAFRDVLTAYNDEARNVQGGQVDIFGDLLTPTQLKNLILQRYGKEPNEQERPSAGRQTDNADEGTPASNEPAAEQITLTDGRVVTPATITHKDIALLGDRTPIQRALIAIRANLAQRPEWGLSTAGFGNDARFLLFEELPDKKSDLKKVEEIYWRTQQEYVAEPNKTEEYRLAADEVLREIYRRLQYINSDKYPVFQGSALISRLKDAELAVAEAETDTNPTEAQEKAENYKQGHVTLWGLPITIENPKGSIRRGTDANGKKWEQKMNNTYGKIRRTEGVDGDHIDVFIGPNLTSDKVFVVDQRNVDNGEFDEHKVMLGFDSLEDTQNGYLSNYEEGWQGMGTVTEVTMDEFKKWIDSSHRKTKPFAEYKSLKTEGAASTAMEEQPNITNESAQAFIGKDISDVRATLGHWWTLDSQKVSGNTNYYFLERAGYGRLQVITDNNNSVKSALFVKFDGPAWFAAHPELKEQPMPELSNETLRKALAKVINSWELGQREGPATGEMEMLEDEVRKLVKKHNAPTLQAALDSIDNSIAVQKARGDEWVDAENEQEALYQVARTIIGDLFQAQKPKARRTTRKAAAQTAEQAQQQPTQEPQAAPQNTIFTEEEAERVRARMRARRNRLNMGIDPEQFADGVFMAGYYMEKGVRKFADFARAMLNEFGEWVRPYLKQWYMGLRYDPRAVGADFVKDMDDIATVDTFDIDNFNENADENGTEIVQSTINNKNNVNNLPENLQESEKNSTFAGENSKDNEERRLSENQSGVAGGNRLQQGGLGRGNRATPADARSLGEKLVGKSSDEQHNIAKQWAQEHGLLLNFLQYTVENNLRPTVGGNENDNWIDTNQGVIYKMNNLMNSDDKIGNLLERVELYNQLFPETELSLFGFNTLGGDRVYPIYTQKYLPDGRTATVEEINDYMQSRGFEPTGEKDGEFTNGAYIVGDVKPRNVLVRPDGGIFVIDADVKRAGQGGGAKKATFEKGQKVKYQNKVDGKLYDATIDSVNADGTYNLLTPNPVFGDVFMGNISEDRISPIEQPKAEQQESPMMKQFQSIKEQYPDATLVFRVGDFYELYEEDAVEASKILGITLAKRKDGRAFAGFPFHALDTYLPKLVRAGKRVAICDQLEDPKKTTKTVKRGVSELVTPGTPYQEPSKVENTEVAEPESVTDNQEPTIPEPNVVTDTVGEITESKHTKTCSPIWVVKPMERVGDAEFRALRKRAKENNGYYSTFVKGYVFNSVNDANRFNNISDVQTTTEQGRADSEAAISTAEVAIAEAEAIRRDSGDTSGAAGELGGESVETGVSGSRYVELTPEQAAEQTQERKDAIQKIDEATERIDKQLAELTDQTEEETPEEEPAPTSMSELVEQAKKRQQKAKQRKQKLEQTLDLFAEAEDSTPALDEQTEPINTEDNGSTEVRNDGQRKGRTKKAGSAGQPADQNGTLGGSQRQANEGTQSGGVGSRSEQHRVHDGERGLGTAGQRTTESVERKQSLRLRYIDEFGVEHILDANYYTLGDVYHINDRLNGEQYNVKASNVLKNIKKKVWTEIVDTPAQETEAPVAEGERKNTRNFRYDPNDPAPTNSKARYEANLAAIRLLKQLQDEDRQATPEEQRILAKFTGWGGLGEFFKGEPGTTYWSDHGEKSPYQVIKELLTDEEMQAAQLSRNSAYFTPPAIIDELWNVAKHLGFKGGNILEGSAGIGNILSQMPQSISDRSNLQAVEIDSITSGILAQLYPDAQVHAAGFQEVDIPNNSQDLVITNVPFVTGLRVYDKKEKDLSKRFGNIHDFCIAKNVRKLRQGGIGIFITSSGTLDNSKDLRRWLNNEGETDVIGAFRLNRETFGGTSATSDIIVVRKRVNGQKDPRAIDVLDTEVARVAKPEPEQIWDRKTNGWVTDTPEEKKLIYNRYFVEHPESMGGEMGFGFEHGDTRWGGTTAGCYPSPSIDQTKRLQDWVESIPTTGDVQTVTVRESNNFNPGTYEEYHGDLPYGSLVLNSKDEICRVYNGMVVPVEGINPTKVKGHEKSEVLKDYNALKAAVEELLAEQAKGISDEVLNGLLKKLNRAYDDFVKKYGNLNRNVSLSFLRNDVQWASMAALENVRETIDKSGKKEVEVSKTDVFSKRVVGVQAEPKAENARDGVILSVQQYGNVRPDMIAMWLERPQEDVEKEIIESRLAFRDPQTGNMVVSHEYLSGNVREKLAYAEEHNENGIYDTNIEELSKVIPVDIPAHLIEFNIGSTWIPVELYHKYLKEKFGVENLRLVHVGSAWISNEQSYGGYALRNEKNRAEGVYSELLKQQIYGHQLMIAAMNNVPVVVSRVEKHYDGTTETITDKAATAACSDKISQIKDDFVEWARGKMQEDSELAERVQKIYNERFNAIVPMLSVDKAFLSPHLPGQNHKYTLYDHQQQAVVRATTQPVMLAHEVGTGKTITLISSAMEMRRLGTAKKPMIVVQNATTPQFVKEAKDLYPNAKILTVSERDRTKEGRQEFYAKIKYNDWDLIIVPQSVFDMIPDSESRMRDFIQEKIEEKLHAIEAAKEANVDEKVTKRMEKELEALQEDLQNANMSGKRSKSKTEKDAKKEAERIENAKARAEEMLDRRTDEVEDFDDMGIDALLIDEAHNYKHLGFATMMTRGVKGIDPSYSKRAAALYLKCQSVYERCGHRNVVFATGTPISNTAAEIWTFMKYLMPKEVLKDNDIYYFDDFVHNFGKIAEQLEFATNGKFKANNRFAQYGNVPELMRIWLTCADCVLTREVGQVNDKVPELEGGKAQDIFLPQSPSLIDIMASVRAELERYEKMSGKEKKENSHIPLTMYGVAKRAAIDPRLVDANAADEPLSKTNKAVEETLRSLKETKKYNGTVAIFCDSYRNLQTGFNLFEDIKAKLVKAGVPAAKIAIIRSEMTDAAKQKIFDAVREGEIRVIMGSTQTLGTGVNIQTRLHTLIHMDAPDRPMDYTQRNGRIIRQGNMHRQWNLPVRVLRFGVEDSLDVTSYQRLKTKAGFIDSIMNGKSMIDNNLENRVLEDVEEGIFDNPVAMLSGSQYALLKSQAERDLRKWQARKQQHDIDQILIAKKLKDNAQIIEHRRQLIATDEQFLQTLKQTFPTGKVTEYNIDGTICHTAAEVKEELKAINAEIQARADKLRKEGYEGSKQNIAVSLQFNGMPFNVNIVLIYNSRWESGQRAITINKEVQYTTPTSDHWLGSPTKVLDKLVEHIEQDYLSGTQATGEINYSRSYIERLQQENELMRQREGKPFEHGAELEKAQALVDEYTEKMQDELAEKEAKYANMSSGRAVTLNEQDDEEETPEAQITDLNYPQFRNQTEAQQLATAALVEVLNDNTDLDVFLATDEEAQKKSLSETATWSELMLHANKAADISSNDGAKLLKNIETTKQKVKNLSTKSIKNPVSFISDVLGLQQSGSSFYQSFKLSNGNIITLRISNHNATVSNFDNEAENEGISIVISNRPNESITNDGNAHIIEYFYRRADLLKAYGTPIADILGSIKTLLETGEYTDTTGLATREEVNMPDMMLTPNGTLYGWAIGDKIYLTKDGLNPNTPIHEYTHLWAKAMRRNNQEGWQSIVEIFKGTPFWDEVVNDPNYQRMTTDDAICSEVLARYSGQRGAARMEEAANELLHEAQQEGTVLGMAKVRQLIRRMKKSLNDFWHWVGTNLFGIKHFDSAEQVADRVLWDMLNGTELKPEDQTTTNNFKQWFGDWQNDPEHASKVVDENGKPLVVEHSTPNEFTTFDINRLGENSGDRGIFGAGFYFGDRGNTDIYGKSHMQVYLNMRKPFVMEDYMPDDILAFIVEHFNTPALRKIVLNENGKSITVGEYIDIVNAVNAEMEEGKHDAEIERISSFYRPDSARRKVRDDAIADKSFLIPGSLNYLISTMIGSQEFTNALRENGNDGVIVGKGNGYNEYVVFSPNQIKSATDNNGEFSTEDNDIERSVSRWTPEQMRAIQEWNEAHPHPQYQVGEKLDHYAQRLSQWEEARKQSRASMSSAKPSAEEAEKADRPVAAGTPAFVPGVKPTPTADESPAEYALRLKQYYQLIRDENLVADYVAEINAQADAAAKGLKKNTLVRGLLDAAKPIENFQEWMAQRGATMTDGSNAYTDTFLASGRVSQAHEQLTRDILRPLAKQIATIIAPDKATGKSRLDGINITWQNMDVPGTGSKIDGKALSPREIIGVYCQAKDCAEAIEKGLPDRGAKGFERNLGMTHDQIIAEVESRIPRAELDEMWRLINAATHFALNYDYESGRISEDTHTEFYQREFYVPQRGWRERDESALVTEYEPVGKRGHDPYNAALVKAHGRQSLAADPFAYIMSIDASSIISSENNKIKQKFLRFCLDNEDLGLKTGAFRIKKYWIMNVIDPETGRIKLDADGNPMMEVSYSAPSTEDLQHDKETKQQIQEKRKQLSKVRSAFEKQNEHGEMPESLQAAYETKIARLEQAIEDLENQMHIAWHATNTNISQRTSDEKKQHEVQVLLDGEKYVIELQDEKLANAINKKFKQHQESLFDTTQKMRNATRFMSAMLTQYNPEFAASNFARDYQVALATLMAEHRELAGPFMKYFATCQGAVWKYAFNDKVRDREAFANDEMGQYLREYFASGAPTGFSYMQDLKSLRRDFDAMVNESNVRRGIKGAVGVFAMLTEVSETAVRFAGFVAARKNGMGLNEAAYLSKELTTNFDRAGEAADTGWMAWFSFFRATLNGNLKFLKALKKMPLAYSLVAVSYFAMGMLNQFLNPDDPDDEIWASDYTRQSNFVLGKIRIPVAHFMRMFFGAGVNASQWIQGNKTFGHAVYNTATFASNEMLPNYLNLLGNGTEWNSRENNVDFTFTGLIQGAMPSPVSPITDVWFNRDFRGATINREPFTKAQEGKKDILMGKEHTLPIYKWLTQAVYEGVGGSMNTEYKSADPAWRSWLFDISPSSVEHVVEGYMPAAMDMFITLGEAIYDAATGTPTGPDKWPFIRKFYNKYTPERAYRQQYYLLRGRVNEFRKMMNDYQKNDPAQYRLLRNSQQYRTYQQTERLVKSEKENPTTADVKALIEANKLWLK